MEKPAPSSRHASLPRRYSLSSILNESQRRHGSAPDQGGTPPLRRCEKIAKSTNHHANFLGRLRIRLRESEWRLVTDAAFSGDVGEPRIALAGPAPHFF